MHDPVVLNTPQLTVNTIVEWIQKVFTVQHKTDAVIAVSGGIDSAVALTLLAQALSPEHIFPLLLPCGEQSVDDSHLICDFNHIPTQNIQVHNIQPLVDMAWSMVDQPAHLADQRRGNIMARARMILVFDRAKALDALVCGTENKSEHWLGYWTRFGDAASDLEPLSTLYKTQVRQLGQHLAIPDAFLTKAPSAGLWPGQTDEAEMGFTYAEADLVMAKVVDGFHHQHGRWPEFNDFDEDSVVAEISPDISRKIINHISHMNFKLHVPYQPEEIVYVS